MEWVNRYNTVPLEIQIVVLVIAAGLLIVALVGSSHEDHK